MKETKCKLITLFMTLTLFPGMVNLHSQGSDNSYRFAVVDIRKNKAMIISQSNQIDWQYDMEIPCDIRILENENILVAGIRDVRELNPAREVIWHYSADKDLFSACKTPEGNYLVGSSGEFKLMELNKDYEVVKEISTATGNKDGHMHSRHVRKFKDGNYWVAICKENLINEYSPKGELLNSISVRGLSEEYGLKNTEKQQAYSIDELGNGNILICAGFPAFVAETDKEGTLVWGLSAEDVPEINFIFSGGAERLENGNTIICNWTGHNYEGDYIPVFGVNMKKKVIWTFDNRQLIPEPLGIDIVE